MSTTNDDLLKPISDYAVAERRLLICVSTDPALLHGVRFVLNFFRPAADLHLELALTPQYALPDTETGRLALSAALDHARTMLEERGFIVTSTHGNGLDEPFLNIRSIARMAEHHSYDAVLLGHRGIHHLEEHLGTAFKETVFDQDLDFPFWLCREPDLTRKNVLLCVDGSKPGLCAADHVGLMCSPEAEHQVCVAYFSDPAKRDYRDEISILDNAVKMLQVNDIPESRIRTKVLVEKDHAQGILREAEQGRYAAVAIGRAGTGRGMMTEQQFGSISLQLARQLTGASLWVGGYPCKL